MSNYRSRAKTFEQIAMSNSSKLSFNCEVETFRSGTSRHQRQLWRAKNLCKSQECRRQVKLWKRPHKDNSTTLMRLDNRPEQPSSAGLHSASLHQPSSYQRSVTSKAIHKKSATSKAAGDTKRRSIRNNSAEETRWAQGGQLGTPDLRKREGHPHPKQQQYPTNSGWNNLVTK